MEAIQPRQGLTGRSGWSGPCGAGINFVNSFPSRRAGTAIHGLALRANDYLAASVARPVAGVPSTVSTTRASPADTPAGTRTLI